MTNQQRFLLAVTHGGTEKVYDVIPVGPELGDTDQEIAEAFEDRGFAGFVVRAEDSGAARAMTRDLPPASEAFEGNNVQVWAVAEQAL